MFESNYVDVGEVRLHVVTAGPTTGIPVLFLHGWPDLWMSFEPQMAALAADGWRVIAPDQRGYGLSDKPPAVSAYEVGRLSSDIVGLIDALSIGPVHIVGHDWGGTVAWALTAERPDLVRSLTAVNCPHPLALSDAMLRPRQLLRAWYMLAFQIPWLPEAILGARRAALQRSMLRFGAGVNEETLDRYQASWAEPGAIGGPVNWYRATFRAAFRERARYRTWDRIAPPVQLIWGIREPVFTNRTLDDSIGLCRQAQVHRLGAGHWPHHDRPVEVTELLSTFMS